MQETVLELKHIEPRPGNRQHGGIDEGKIQELAASIRDQGLLNPILVRPIHKRRKFELIAGERRFRACTIAGLERIPARLAPDDATDEWIELAAIVENVQRQDIHALDESDAYQRLRQIGLAGKEIAAKVGRHANHVSIRLRLQKLTDDARAAMVEGKIGIGHAEILATLPPALQGKGVKELIKENAWRRSPEQLGWWIRDQTDLLTEAPFDTADATLTKAPACGDCPLRVALSQRDLFDDVGEQDRCGDRKCWNKKTGAHVQRSREQLEASGRKFIEASSVYANKKKKGVWYPDDWTVSEAKNARYVLMVDGERAGAILRGVKTRSVHRHVDYEEEERKRKEKEAQRRQLLVAVAAAITPERAEELLAGDEMRRVIAESMAGHYEAADHLPVLLPDADPESAYHVNKSKLESVLKDAGAGELARWIVLAHLAQYTTRFRPDRDPLMAAAVEHKIVEPEPEDEKEAPKPPAEAVETERSSGVDILWNYAREHDAVTIAAAAEKAEFTPGTAKKYAKLWELAGLATIEDGGKSLAIIDREAQPPTIVWDGSVATVAPAGETFYITINRNEKPPKVSRHERRPA